MMKALNNTVYPRAVSVLVLIAGICCLIALRGGGHGDREARSDPAFDPVALNIVSALTRPARPLPIPLRQSLHADLGPTTQTVILSAARKVATHVWVVGGNGLVCLVVSPSGAATCSDSGRFVRQGLFLGTFKAKGHDGSLTNFVMVGVTPDRVRYVEIEYDRHKRSLPINRNVVRFQADSPILVHRLVTKHGLRLRPAS